MAALAECPAKGRSKGQLKSMTCIFESIKTKLKMLDQI
jgi:hypothetical protein